VTHAPKAVDPTANPSSPDSEFWHEQRARERRHVAIDESLAGAGAPEAVQERNGISIDQAREAWEQVKRDLTAANARADAAERIAANRLQTFLATSDTLEKAVAAHKRAESEAASVREHLRVQTAALAEDLSAARAEAASLRTEVERLTAHRERLAIEAGRLRPDYGKRLLAESSLAAATALLGEWLTIGDRDPYAGLRTRTNAFLANAPAAPTREVEIERLRDRIVDLERANESANMTIRGLRIQRDTGWCERCEEAHVPSPAACNVAAPQTGAFADASPVKMMVEPTRTDHDEVRQYDGHAWVRLDSLRSTRSESCPFGRDPCDSCTCWQQRPTRTDHERAVLRIVRKCCQDSRTWMQANMPELFAADEALRRREAEK
jgi:hypothetical protein